MKNLYYFILMLCLPLAMNAQNNYGPTDDFDGDGITNENDLDDDNDGILDITESFCEAYVTAFVPTSDFNVSFPSRLVGEPNLSGTRFNSGPFYNSSIIIDFGQVLTAGTVIYFEARKEGIADKTLYIQSAPDGDYNNLGSTGSIIITNNQYNTVPDVPYTLPESSRYYVLRRDDSYTTDILIDGIIHSEGNNCSIADLTDEDNDNIPDKFDLDSDEDGCPDSLEGEGTQILLSQVHVYATNSDPFQNGMINTAIGSNGVPLIVGAGNNLGTSENPFEQADECDYWCSNLAGPDTDGDGRGDECDVDDDNDGILDIDEGLQCTSYAHFFNGTRTYIGNGDINNAKEDGVLILADFLRELDASGNELASGQKYDLRVELTEIYQPSTSTFMQNVDFNWSGSTSSDELVVFTGGPPSNNPYIKMSMILIEPGSYSASQPLGIPIGLSDATIRFSDIDSNSNTNFTDVVGVLNNDNQLKSSSPILPGTASDIEAGGFAAGTLPAEIIAVNSTYDLYRLKKEGGSNGPWYAYDNATIPNASPNITAGYKFDQLNTLNVVWGYTTDAPNPSSTTNLTRGLAFSRDEVKFCVFTDTDKDGIPNEEDLDSDGDGCPDVIEGGGTFQVSDIVNDNAIPGGNNYDGSAPGFNGTVNLPIYETLQFGPNSANSYGIPRVVNGYPTPNDLTGTQAIGSSQDININGCSCEKDARVVNDPNMKSLVGITTIDRGMNTASEVVTSYSNGFIALESKTLGFVPTRIASPENVFDNSSSTSDPKDDAVEGMLVWDPANNCLRLFDGIIWRCIRKGCNGDVTSSRNSNN